MNSSTNQAPQVFVDDHDPGITYTSNWSPDTNLTTFLQPIGAIGNDTPRYGTLHTYVNTGTPGSVFYSFEGTAVTAFVSGLANCTIDDSAISISTADDQQRFACSNAEPLPPGKHNISIDVLSSSLNTNTSFDGLFYTPLTSPAGALDMVFTPPNDEISFNLSLPVEENTLKSTEPALLNYTIDGGEAVTFNVSNPFPFSTFGKPQPAVHKLAMQTSKFDLGEHTFHMELLGPDINPTPFKVSMIFVQAADRNLDAFPAPPRPIPSHTSNSLQELPNQIMFILLPVFCFLVLHFNWRTPFGS
ncbi:hypothetical protein CPC08DRAFT_785088 [Agrocybe pediades]|nr:hypothetical protein CPC08DRAFT_785088 [Agrocybe pediades]